MQGISTLKWLIWYDENNIWFCKIDALNAFQWILHIITQKDLQCTKNCHFGTIYELNFWRILELFRQRSKLMEWAWSKMESIPNRRISIPYWYSNEKNNQRKDGFRVCHTSPSKRVISSNGWERLTISCSSICTHLQKTKSIPKDSHYRRHFVHENKNGKLLVVVMLLKKANLKVN